MVFAKRIMSLLRASRRTLTWVRPRPMVGLLAAIGLGVFLWGAYIPMKTWAAQALLERAWDRAVAGDATASPWAVADIYPVARLSVARLGVSNIVLSGADGRALAFGPGHVGGTTAPGGRGHSVISAHRDAHFAWLKDAAVGDLIDIARPNGAKASYRIVEMQVIDSRKNQVMLHPGRDLLTLITGYPIENQIPDGPMRLIATAESRF